jgi:hypothetical protein
MKRSSKTIEMLRSAVQAAEHVEHKAKQRGSYGAASDCRRRAAGAATNTRHILKAVSTLVANAKSILLA